MFQSIVPNANYVTIFQNTIINYKLNIHIWSFNYLNNIFLLYLAEPISLLTFNVHIYNWVMLLCSSFIHHLTLQIITQITPQITTQIITKIFILIILQITANIATRWTCFTWPLRLLWWCCLLKESPNLTFLLCAKCCAVQQCWPMTSSAGLPTSYPPTLSSDKVSEIISSNEKLYSKYPL